MVTSLTTQTFNGDLCELPTDPGKSPRPWKRSKEDGNTKSVNDSLDHFYVVFRDFFPLNDARILIPIFIVVTELGQVPHAPVSLVIFPPISKPKTLKHSIQIESQAFLFHNLNWKIEKGPFLLLSFGDEERIRGVFIVGLSRTASIQNQTQCDSQFLEDESTKIFARKVADHYSARTNQTLEEREGSPIIHLKKLNNWGGDLIKWDKANIGYYVGIDIAKGSRGVENAKAFLGHELLAIFSCLLSVSFSWPITGAVVGLHYHDHLAIKTAEIPKGYSMLNFKTFLRDSYDLKIRDSSQTEKPTLILVSRKKSSVFMNEDEMVTMMKALGFRVVIAQPYMMANMDKFAEIVKSCSILVGSHGAGLTNAVFLPEGAVLVQVVGLGIDWISNNFGLPAPGMGLNYIDYKIEPKESSLISLYGKDHPVIVDPESITSKGYEVGWAVYLIKQNFNIDVVRFRKTLVKALGLLGRSAPLG
ncbi:hypothetical protein RHMOL_Rhmol11G0220300 [Rhododendron molle]|uniref:Uncharacterized protein n=1 Tax=Rhododendron molle TaxID=49168 RepID=A0ACC0LUY7_RHOML|nr:hypothetical protein RHMOL_Rhmol11G0220300 [Rhododendron molle]